VVFASFLLSIVAKVKIDTKTYSFIDDSKRTLIFHGVNAVYKIAPWHPTTTGFDATTTLSDEDSKNLKSWGMNIVRLGVMWPGVEPKNRGEYDQSYLDQIETIVTSLGKQGISVILDFHQDIWHRAFCGEGVPDYVYNTCKANEPSGTKAFPLPSVNATYPLDADGYPTLDSCLSKMFATYYLSAEVGAGFQCLYNNVDNLWDAFAGYWTTVATRFRSFENVLGYELINEPWAGDVYEDPKRLLPHYTEQKYLQPLYQHLHKAIRAVDNEKIIFFEGLTIDYWQGGFTETPGGSDYNDRQALAYHIYCPVDNNNSAIIAACNLIDDYFFAMREKDAHRLGITMLMTEFGAAEDIHSDLVKMASLLDLADRHQQSWMYWQFKYYQDLTTCTPEGESLYNADGTVCTDKLNVLSRSYPQATAGKLLSYHYSIETKKFTMEYQPWSSVDGSSLDGLGTVTEIYVNRDMTFTNGFQVKITSNGPNAASAVQVQCPSIVKDRNLLSIKQSSLVSALSDGTAEVLSVEISHCSLTDMSACTCK